MYSTSILLITHLFKDRENFASRLPIFNSIQFNSIQFNSIQFNSIQFNSIQFNSIQFNSIQFNSIQFIKIYKFAPCKVNYIIYYKNDYKLNMLTQDKMIYYNIVKNYKNFDITVYINTNILPRYKLHITS